MVSRLLKSLLAARDGTTAIEYALIGSVISIAIITGVGAVGGNVEGIFDAIAAHMP